MTTDTVQARLKEIDREAHKAAMDAALGGELDIASARSAFYREQVHALLEQNKRLEMQMAAAWQERGGAMELVAETREQNARLREALASTKSSMLNCWCVVPTINERGTVDHEPQCLAKLKLLSLAKEVQDD